MILNWPVEAMKECARYKHSWLVTRHLQQLTAEQTGIWVHCFDSLSLSHTHAHMHTHTHGADLPLCCSSHVEKRNCKPDPLSRR